MGAPAQGVIQDGVRGIEAKGPCEEHGEQLDRYDERERGVVPRKEVAGVGECIMPPEGADNAG